MFALSQAREARVSRGVLAAVDLRQGLAVSEVHTHLQQGLRLQDTGQRILAYYLTEMEERRLYQATGHSSTVFYAEARLGLDRRRTRELIAVGRKLLTLTAIDGAFCEQKLGWSKVLHLVKVVTPEHEAAWLERAFELTCRELALEVQRAKAGGPPRARGDRKGLPDIRFKVRATVGVLTHQKLDLAKKKLSDELGRAVDDAECFDVMAELFLNMEEDGTVPGRKRVDASLYRILLREDENDANEAVEPGLIADSILGSLPVVGSELIRCDAEPEQGKRDAKTSRAQRRRILDRDGRRCRCCGSRNRLMVHHIEHRSKGGRTRRRNLITLCVSCHSMVHAGLLVLEGPHALEIRFRDAQGRPLHEPGETVPPAALVSLSLPQLDIPAEDEPAEDEPAEKQVAVRQPLPFEEAFAGIVGQDALLERLETAAVGSRARGLSFPHTLFVGPPGTGKTTLARCIARQTGSRLLETAGPLLQDADALLRLLSELGSGGVLFIDEIHATPRPVMETLYEAMSERRFTLLAATTEDGDLPHALRTRFGLREFLDYYAAEDLSALVARAAGSQHFVLDEDAATRLAESARGTPREALRLLDRVLDMGACSGQAALDRATVELALERLGFDREGLDPPEQRYLALLRRLAAPVSLERLARMLGTHARALTRHLEPYLFRRGLVRMTARGRVAVRAPQLLGA